MASLPDDSAPTPSRRRCLTASLALALVLSLATCDQRTPGPTGTAGPLPDYSVSVERAQSNGPADDLSTVRFRVRVVNSGGSTASASTVSMYIDGRFVEDRVFRGLAGTRDTTFLFSWSAAAGRHDFLFTVDRPVSGAGFVAESQEDNNTASISLTLPYILRVVAAQDTVPFSSLLAAVAADSLVQQILELASDSGYTVAPGAAMIRTAYTGGIVSYHVPLVNLQAPATSGPLLIINESHLLGRTQAFAYLLQAVDSTTFVFYDAHGGVRVSRDGQQYRLDGLQAQMGSCSWRRLWPCVVAIGIEPILDCVVELRAVVPGGSMEDLVAVLTENGCASAFAAFPNTRHLLVDKAPTLYASVIEMRDCDSCDTDDNEHTWSSWTYVLSATDDRGGVTYLSDLRWEVPCGGGQHMFSARDNAGQVTMMPLTVNLPGPYGHWMTPPPDNACHDQGDGSAMRAPFLRSVEPSGAGKLASGRVTEGTEKPLCTTSREGLPGSSLQLTPFGQASGSPVRREVANAG